MIDFAIQRIKFQIGSLPIKVLALSEEDLLRKPFPDKWSKKEILGHLIDSATHNHHRFINAYLFPGMSKIVKYNQEEWVKINQYQNQKTSILIEFWVAYNKHILNLIQNMTEERLKQPCDIGEMQTVSLAWLINDYADHMEGHIHKIVN